MFGKALWIIGIFITGIRLVNTLEQAIDEYDNFWVLLFLAFQFLGFYAAITRKKRLIAAYIFYNLHPLFISLFFELKFIILHYYNNYPPIDENNLFDPHPLLYNYKITKEDCMQQIPTLKEQSPVGNSRIFIWLLARRHTKDKQGLIWFCDNLDLIKSWAYEAGSSDQFLNFSRADLHLNVTLSFEEYTKI